MGLEAENMEVSRPGPRGPRVTQRASGARVLLISLILLSPSAIAVPPIEDQPPSGNEGLLLLERMQQAFESLGRRLAPSVVSIRAELGPQNVPGDTPTAPGSTVVSGSGVIIRRDGMILTCQHVIDGAQALYVTLPDARRLRARLVAADPRSDMAILKVDADGLPQAPLGDARDARPGHIVLALGNPLGLANDGTAALSQGVVSAIGRPLPASLGRQEDRYYRNMIQTTARVGPGNSGGPLIDIHGRVIGIITVQGSSPGHPGGIGFAVPIDAHTKDIIDGLMQGRHIEYGYLGVQVRPPTKEQARAAGLPNENGAVLDSILSDGPAARAGLEAGDIIIALDDTPVRSTDHFIRLVGAAGPRQRLEISFVRDRQRRTKTVLLEHRLPPPTGALPTGPIPFRGAVLSHIHPDTHEWSNLPGPALLVAGVSDGSPADLAGLTPGDVIVRIQGQTLTQDATGHISRLTGDVLLGLANGGSVLVKE